MPRRRRVVAAVLAWALAASVLGVAGFVGGLLTAPVDLRQPVPERSTVLLASDGTRVVATLRPPLEQVSVAAAQIPLVLREAVVASEDRTFYRHNGVDPLAVVRAAYRDLTGGREQGGSTITQQYVKNVYVGSRRTLLRKVKEAALAVRLEQKLSKDEILTDYLNNVFLGNATKGVEAACRFYFGVSVKDLDLDPVRHKRSPALALGRAAMIAGIIPAPSYWNPVAAPDVARAKELAVLNKMIGGGVVTSAQASDAYGSSRLRIARAARPEPPSVAPEFRDLVRQRVSQAVGPEVSDKGGLRVVTTLDYDLQQASAAALGAVLDQPGDPEAAVVALDPRSGDVRALTTRLVGGGHHGYTEGGFDLATDVVRQSGSTIKPFTLATALEQGHSPDEYAYGPAKLVIPYKPQPFVVENSDPTEAGGYSLRTAMEKSVNTVYAPLAIRVGLRRVMATARAAGFSPTRYLQPYPASSLGVNVTPLALTTAFATLADHGVRHAPRVLRSVAVTDDSGAASDVRLRTPDQPSGASAMPARVADAVVGVLRGVVTRGTAHDEIHQPDVVWGKTGTVANYIDAWFVGCTSEVCLGVWMGYDDPFVCPGGRTTCRPAARIPHAMNGLHGVDHVYGGTLPARIFDQALTRWRALREAAAHPTPSASSGSPSPSPTSSSGPDVATPVPVATRRPRRRRPRPVATAAPSPAPRRTAPPSPTPTAAPSPRPSSSPRPVLPLPSPSPTRSP